MILTFFYAFTISFVSLLVVIYFSHKHTYFIDCHKEDKPQKFHTDSTPRAGGIGIVVALMLLAFIPFGLKLIPSIILAFASGIFEDFHNSLSPKIRLSMQTLAAAVAVWLTDSVVTYLGLGVSLPYSIGVVFSIFAIVGMVNAINIIDGFNGLASGVILMILTSFAVVSLQHQNSDLLYVITVTGGATFAFFLFVFPKGKIFLGDGGAYLLGFVVALIGIFLAGTYEKVSPWYILSIFIYPVWEVLFSIVRKKSIGLSPMQPDNYHMHMLVHRQLAKSNPHTAVIIMLMCLPFMLFSTYFPHSSIYNITVAVLFVCGYLVLYRYLYGKDILEK